MIDEDDTALPADCGRAHGLAVLAAVKMLGAETMLVNEIAPTADRYERW